LGMKVVSTTLVNNSVSIVGDALRSVSGWVDECILIDTGPSRDGTLETARDVCMEAGRKLYVRPFEWCDDFAAARNFALESAAHVGADWAVTVDADERIDIRGADIRRVLEVAEEKVLRVNHDSGTYCKDRFIRLPAVGRWVGPMHEAYSPPVNCRTLSGVRFSELSKPPEVRAQEFQRCARVLEKYANEHPGDPRWWYYLGDALQNLGKHRPAADAYQCCYELRGWNEESAWACYRAAECFISMGDFRKAEEVCAMGLSRHAGIAELAWLAAYASWKRGKAEQAVYWSGLSIALGCYRGCGQEVVRIGFRNPAAQWEGPYDVLRFAYRGMREKPSLIAEAEMNYEAAKAARLAEEGK